MSRYYELLPYHDTTLTLQRHCKIYQRARAARKHDRQGRPGIESRAHDPEHGPSHDSSCMRWFVEALARYLPQMGERTDSMGGPDRPTRCHRRENRGDGWQ